VEGRVRQGMRRLQLQAERAAVELRGGIDAAPAATTGPGTAFCTA
jgi:hypothetical protein